jgi:hypothetical protein
VKDPLNQLAERIRSELVEIERAVRRAEEGWRRARLSADDYYLDSVAPNLHGFYSGVERLFERIAVVVDGTKPAGENWHMALLQQMSSEMKAIRPAVISNLTRTGLDEYRGFRHVVRNVYTFNFEVAKVENLVTKLGPLFEEIQKELLAFSDFLVEQVE